MSLIGESMQLYKYICVLKQNKCKYSLLIMVFDVSFANQKKSFYFLKVFLIFEIKLGIKIVNLDKPTRHSTSQSFIYNNI